MRGIPRRDLAGHFIFRRGALFLLAAMIGGLTLAVPALGGEEQLDDQAQERLAWMRDNQSGMWNISPREGLYLYNLILKHHLKKGLEIGTSNAYSGIWIASALRATGGHLTTLEIDQERADLAEDNFRAAGVEALVTLERGDALQKIPELDDAFDFVLIDAAKSDYVRYLEMVLPRVPAGGVIVAHNIRDMAGSLQDFIERVRTDPQLKTSFVDPGPGGFSVSIKRRAN